MAATRKIDPNSAPGLKHIEEEYEDHVEVGEPAFTPRTAQRPKFLSTWVPETEKECVKLLQDSVKANDNKLNSEISENIQKKFSITENEVKQIFHFVFPCPITDKTPEPIETPPTEKSPSGPPVIVKQVSGGEDPEDDQDVIFQPPAMSKKITGGIPNTTSSSSSKMKIMAPPAMKKQITGSDNDILGMEEDDSDLGIEEMEETDDEPPILEFVPRAMQKKTTELGDGYGEAIEEHIEKDGDDPDEPAFVPKTKSVKKVFSGGISPPTMKPSQTGCFEDDESSDFEDHVENDASDNDEPQFAR